MAVFDKIAPPSTPKAKRLSSVALAGAILAVIWAIVDEFTAFGVSAVIVSAITSLVMLMAGFYDFRAGDDVETFAGEPE